MEISAGDLIGAKRFKVDTPQQCVDRCVQHSECTHANWSKKRVDNQITCWNKKKGKDTSPSDDHPDYASLFVQPRK
ncbi:hypothetical protein POX_a01885 [Penicillium oxalicum]|uniref:hypothetical protein n=1 Tax=Penicillium oxalicum TaxID=69781 RepID=UPI0020B6DDF6|nr:hypothetical protein POX_a01885 [Penicillium oxalicum]KAI2795280.1 hypothetical protein POX_a01885 [Penicillium oxalicum]